jgi:hypothetical protein
MKTLAEQHRVCAKVLCFSVVPSPLIVEAVKGEEVQKAG